MSSMDVVNATMIGAIAMGFVVAGGFFLQFWTHGRDRFFLLFALSFFVEGANRIAQALSDSPNEGTIGRYSVRLLGFLLILAAIHHKNGQPRRGD